MGGWGGKGRIGEVWNSLVVVSDVLSKFSKIENLFFFRGSVRCQHQLKLHTFEHE